MLGLSTVSGVGHVQERKEGRNGVEEGDGVQGGEAAEERTEGRPERGSVPVREGTGTQDGGSEVPDAAEHEETKAMRGASEGQEGAYLLCDGVNVLVGGTGGLEGHRGEAD